MNRTLHSTIEFLRAIARSSQLKTRRHKTDVLADRIRQAATADGLASCIENLCVSMDVEAGFIAGETISDFVLRLRDPDAELVLRWLRHHSRLASMIASLRDDAARIEAVEAIDLGDLPAQSAVTARRPDYRVCLVVECLSPMVHGDDHRSGNATLFRRMDVLTDSGRVDALPYYGGNALRGQFRDLLADHLLRSLGLSTRRDRPILAPWFFQVLYAGGALEEKSAPSSRAIGGLLGRGGAIRTEGMRQLRDTLPALSLLGCAIGNKVLPGRIQVADLRPRCRQWGTGDRDVSELFSWTFLTRREDRDIPERDHAGMIATSEALKAGTILDGGIDWDPHIQDMERSALGRALSEWQAKARLGAQCRMGLGEVRVSVCPMPDPSPYDAFLESNKASILTFLGALGALVPTDYYDSVDNLATNEDE